ncbi:gliding motility protein [Dyadobacter sp. CY261]|uniref:gliding motility protein GldB-related protein n=1 Tax=Dyadobacter sp. CY261 TaxID=2907203 RepID=UPI001F432843|nr:gliding motility protein [Dyadobacter sp. CY261]MCF0071638.1 gliding motility protein [Dyadobacter sp. CY261]
MVYFRSFVFIFFIALFQFSCKTDQRKEADTSNIRFELVSKNLDEELFSCKSVGDVQKFLDNHPYLAKAYFTNAPVEPTKLAAHLFSVLQNPDLQAFRTQLDSIIGNRKTRILNPLSDAFKQIKAHYPGFPIPEVQFIITGFTGDDLYISDSLIIIGLDYFGGPAASYRPNIYDYQLRRYERAYIVPSIIFFESNKYNRMNAGDQTLLSDMVGYGKGYEFVKRVMPQTPDSLIVGYSADDLRKTYNSQTDIWAYFISSKLLYEKSGLKKRKFIDDRPFTTEIGNKVPGAIGRWVGWRIVSRFMAENPNVSLTQLMEIDNAGRILQESGYKGQTDEDQ